jgi:MFS superfamily sulfate permease-like transporter
MPTWLFGSLRGYRRQWLRGDLIAGLTVWAVLVPEALAYASIAGVSPVVGLYAAPGALIFYAAFGSSKHLVTGPGRFLSEALGRNKHLGDTHLLTLVIAVLSLAIVLGLRRFAPHVPGSLVAVAFGIVLVDVFSLDKHGVAIVGHIARGLPSFGVPKVSFSDYVELLSSAVGLMLVGFAEGLGAATTYAARAGYEIDVNRELLGLGGANLASGLSSGMVVNGASRRPRSTARPGRRVRSRVCSSRC